MERSFFLDTMPDPCGSVIAALTSADMDLPAVLSLIAHSPFSAAVPGGHRES